MKNNYVNIENLCMKYFVENKEVVVFNDFNLNIDITKINLLVGKSGSGKTTLLRLISGLEKPTSGTINIPSWIKVGIMFQEPRLMPWLNCEKNITLGLKNSDKTKVEEILNLVGLKDFKKAYPSQLSTGMKQRVSLARTLIRDTNLILMDEPFSSLDSNTKSEMMKLLIRVKNEKNAGVIFVTHDLKEAESIGDKIISLDKVK